MPAEHDAVDVVGEPLTAEGRRLYAKVGTPVTEKDVAAMQNQPKKDDHAGHDHAMPPAQAAPAPAGTATGQKK